MLHQSKMLTWHRTRSWRKKTNSTINLSSIQSKSEWKPLQGSTCTHKTKEQTQLIMQLIKINWYLLQACEVFQVFCSLPFLCDLNFTTSSIPPRCVLGRKDLQHPPWPPAGDSMRFWGVDDSIICTTGGRLWCADGQDCWMCYKSPVLQEPGLELKQDTQALGLGHTHHRQNELKYLFWEPLAGHLHCALDSDSVLLHLHVKLWLSGKLPRPRFLQIRKYKSCQTIKDNYCYLANEF